MAEADEIIITRFLVETSEAMRDVQALRTLVDDIKVQLKSAAKETGQSFDELSQKMLKAFSAQPISPQGIKQFQTAMTTALAEVKQEQEAQAQASEQQKTALSSVGTQAESTAKSFRLFGVEIKNVGDLARAVLLGIFGISVITVLRNVVNGLKEATQAGYEFGKAIFQLEVGARALQRAGVDVTIEQIYGQLSTLQERFKIFTTKDLVVGTAAFLNLNRDMGFTREQLFKLQDAIATLAVVNGRAMDEVQRTVALALSSGYTEGLQRLGVSINRVTIANEAQRLGFAKSYMSLTEQQRALATYNLVIQKTAIYQEDLQKYYDTAPGAIDRTKTAFKEITNQLSLMIATNLGLFLQDINRFLDEGRERIDRFKATRFGEFLQSIVDSLESIAKTDAAYKWIDNLANRITKLGLTISLLVPPIGAVILALGRLLDVSNELNQGILGDETVGETERQANQINEAVSSALEDLEQFQKDYADKAKDIETDYLRDIEKLERDAGRRRVELARDLARDLAEIERDGLQRREDLQQDYFNNLRKIGEDLARDIAEETAKYNLAVAQTIRDFALRRSEAEARYRENEIKAEIRFQEEMRRLREGFLFDLEDALHERDARQVLRLIRQYNLQKGQAERQAEIERDERRRAFELEMRELEAQRQERLRILAEEHAARIRALQEQAAYERELARRKYEEDKAELERKLEEEKQARIAKALEAEEELARKLEEAKTDRKALLDQQIADLEAERDRLLQEIGDKLWNSLQITTDEGLKQLYDALVASLGPDGGADQVFKYYAGAAEAAAKQVEGSLTRVAAMMAQIYAFVAQLNSLSGSSPGGGGGGGRGSTPIPNPNPNTRQSGGPVYAGEIYQVHKDEKFVPAVNGRILSVQQSQQAVAQSRSPVGTGGEGSLKIRIGLSDGLIGEIVDMAGDVVSDVVFELERKRN